MHEQEPGDMPGVSMEGIKRQQERIYGGPGRQSNKRRPAPGQHRKPGLACDGIIESGWTIPPITDRPGRDVVCARHGTFRYTCIQLAWGSYKPKHRGESAEERAVAVQLGHVRTSKFAADRQRNGLINLKLPYTSGMVELEPREAMALGKWLIHEASDMLELVDNA